jgi:hypothetical protein
MAWYEPRRRVGVYYPAPMHWVMRGWREFIYRLRLAIRAPQRECADVFEMQRMHRERTRLADEYGTGYLAGWRDCFRTCMEAVEEEMARSDDLWEVGALFADTKKPPLKN